MSFKNWQRKEAGEKVKSFLTPGIDDEGYYRRPITEPVLGANGKTNGQKRIIDWEAVAYFLDGDGVLRGVIGDRDMTPNEVTDEHLWSWVCNRTISEQLYRAVAERGEPWPDLTPANKPVVGLRSVVTVDEEIPAANREVARSDNQPPELLPHLAHAEAIDNAIAAAQAMQITNDHEAAQVAGMKNRLAELRLAADKAGHAIYDPLRLVYETEQKKWAPIVKRADAMEKELHRRFLIFRDQQKRAAEKAAAEAAAKQREIDEANERAAQRAIARGEAESAPVIVEEAPPAAAGPASPAVVPLYGTRKVREVEAWHLDGIDDFDAVYGYFKHTQEIRAALTVLARAATKAGRDVPGVKKHFGLV
jgi:hypothetical protein